MFARLVLALVFTTPLFACTTLVEGGGGGQTGSSTTTTGGAGGAHPEEDAGGGCTHDDACAAGEVCAFVYDEMCNSIECSLPYTACPAKGRCVEPVMAPCGAIDVITACACDDTTVKWTTGCSGLPHGVSPVPIRSLGPCAP